MRGLGRSSGHAGRDAAPQCEGRSSFSVRRGADGVPMSIGSPVPSWLFKAPPIASYPLLFLCWRGSSVRRGLRGGRPSERLDRQQSPVGGGAASCAAVCEGEGERLWERADAVCERQRSRFWSGPSIRGKRALRSHD